MNLVKETLYPNNGKRPLNPSNLIGDQQIKELADYKAAGMLPPGIDAIANGKPLFGSAWTNSAWLARTSKRKTWQSANSCSVVVPGRNPDGSYKMRAFAPGTSFDFSLWHLDAARFYNGNYGRFFAYLPVLEVQTFTAEEARDANYDPGPAVDYPLGLLSPSGNGFMADRGLRFDEAGELKIFAFSEFRTANPIVGEQTHTIPAPVVGVSDAMLLSAIANIATTNAMPETARLNMIRGMLGAPIPGGGTPVDAI